MFHAGFVRFRTAAPTLENTGTSWTPCSKSCGMGVQVRYAPNLNCNKIERQTRLCHLRPCEATSRQENVVVDDPNSQFFVKKAITGRKRSKQRFSRNYRNIERLHDSKKSRKNGKNRNPVKRICRKKKTNIRKTGKIFLNYAGCTTKKTYSLKYCIKTCGTFQSPMCCEETVTKSIKVKFWCRTDNFEDGDYENCKASRDGKFCSFVKQLAVVKGCKCGNQVSCPSIRDKYEVPGTKIVYQWNLRNDMEWQH